MAEANERPPFKGKEKQTNRLGKNKAVKNIKQTIFVRLSEMVSQDADLHAFLLHRMAPKVIPFKIIERPTNGSPNTTDGTSRLVLLFESKSSASKAVNMLHKSNKKTTSKIHCFFTSEEEKGLKTDSKEKVENRFEHHMKEIFEAAKAALENHEIKIRSANKGLIASEKLLRGTTGPSLEEYETMTSEVCAREDKLNELKLQRREFKCFLSDLNLRLEKVKFDQNFEAKVLELRKYLGIECNRLKCALPMYARRSDILDIVEKNQVSVILGETGSGKSTQMAQYIYQAGFASGGMIACTQPRKIAAVSLATHVASEMASCVGQVVGYQVGMQKRKSAITKILYMTDHVLLNECLKNSNLPDFSCLIIDEAHERSIVTDILLGMIKSCLQHRPDLKVIITSATIDPGVFVSYFGGPAICPVLRVSGRTFPVTVFYMEENDEQPFPEKHEDKALKKAIEIHSEFPVADGDILVFLTSPLETEKCCENFQKTVSGKDYKCLQLHGKLQHEEQKSIFEPLPPGFRKIVFATNSAETSITIPGIKFVVDTGLAKEMRYDPKKNMNSLSIYPVSRSSAEQRKGRAGRMAPGTCYRLFTDGDFTEMESNTKPEILRVHLGQALLKLLELGVNPLAFDFVESPPRSSLEIAMKSLQEIDTVKDGAITELGRWVAKLPLEPRLGVLVKNGIDKGVPIEAMILAGSCCSGGMFFRMGTEEEKKSADVQKTKFCHPGGDMMTMLNVFKDWHNVNEKDKGKWCKQNSINGKSMKGIRETIKEVLTILKREMKEEIKFELKQGDNTDELLQGLVIKCMKNNVCCFLGHEQAGYITAKQLQHVQIHPSSSMKSLGQTPRLLVYWQLLQTSRTFITNLTPVEEELLKKSETEVSVEINEEEIQRQCVSLTGKFPVGNLVFRKFVGPLHKNRREKEEQIRALCENTIVIIEANREIGEIQLFCNQKFSSFANAELQKEIKSFAEPLKQQAVEVHLGKNESGVRAILGEGGVVKDILMPYQYRTVKIKLNDNEDLTEEDVHNALSLFGDLEDVFRYRAKGQKCNVFWGKATFCRQDDANKAVQTFKEKEQDIISLVPEKFGSDKMKGTTFTLKLTWLRRSSKGFGYVNLERPEDLSGLLTSRTLLVDSSIISVFLAKKGNLYLKGFRFDVTEEAVIKALAQARGVEADRSRFQVIIPRTEALNDGVDPQQVIKRKLEQYVPEDSFRVNVREIKPKTVKGMAFVTFTNADHFQTAANQLVQGSHMYLNGNPVDITVDLKSSLHLTKKVYEAVKEDLDVFIKEADNNIPRAAISVKEMKSGNYAADIYATSTADMAAAKVGIHKILAGDCLESRLNEAINRLFTHDAREFLKNVEQEIQSVVTVDDRTMSVRIQGSAECRTRTLILINEYLGKMANSSEKQIILKGQNNPVGLMKAVLIKYGTDLEKLKTECNLLSVSLKHRYHSICITGQSSAIEKATSLIESVKTELAERNTTRQSDDLLPECPICLCEIELNELVRLEYCGHPYCQPCLKSQVESAVQDKQFPLVCAVENCNSSFVQQDLRKQTEKAIVKLKPLAAAAVSCCVTKNQKVFRYCITADCEIVYRVSEDGRQFQCPECGARMCTTCHIQFHDGLTCAMYQGAKTGEGSVELWVKEKPDARKKCPKCHVGIEKIAGCNHMTCSCKAHICWVCLAVFSSGSECYGHLRTAHGTFM